VRDRDKLLRYLAKQPPDRVQIGSLEMVLLWQGLRNLANQSGDPVTKTDALRLLKKLGGKP